MYVGKTLFAQVMDFLPWKTFHRIVDRYGGDHRTRSLSCAEQFRVMAFAQLTYRESLRDIEVCLAAQAGKLYHMGISAAVARSTLADANESRDWRIYLELAQRLITKARALYVDEDFGVELANTVYAIDATTIDLCLSMFPCSTKAAVKLHTLLDQMHDVNVLDLLLIEAGAFYIMDRGLPGLRAALRARSSGRLLHHARQAKSRCTARVLGAGGPRHRTHLRPDHCSQRLLCRQALPRLPASHPLSRSRDRQEPGVPDQPVCVAGADHLRPVPVPMAGGAVLQVDQAAPAHQTLLRHFRERCADANLDRHQRLRADGDHQEETSSERVPAYAATDLVADALRETAAETSGCGRRANRNQPRILQATESIRVLTGRYWVEMVV